MKIVHTSTRIKIKYGGGEKFLEQFITEMSEYEHIFIGQDPVVFDIFKKHGKEAYSSPAGFEPITLKRKLIIPLSFILGFIQFIKFYRFWKTADIIYVSASSIAEPIFLLPWIKLFFPKKRMIQSMHCMCIDYYWKNPLVGILRNTWKNMEMVFISNNQINDWKSHSFEGCKNYLVYNGVRVFEDNFGAKKDKMSLKIGYIGRMYYQKGVETMIKSLAKIKIPNLKVDILMGGDGEDLNNFVNLQKSLIFSPNFTFHWLGFQEDSNLFYEKCDLIIFPSWLETFSLVLLESWERGLPVITSNIPAFLEAKKYMPEEENRLIFSLKNEDDLVDKINLFVSSLDFYTSEKYKKELHNSIKKNFSMDKMFYQYREIFKM